MAKSTYLCIQRSQRSDPAAPKAERPKPSPAQMQEMFAKFNAWKDKYKGNIIDMGGQLGEGAVVSADAVVDGPFVEVKEVAGGFMIIEAETLAEAIKVAQDSPGVGKTSTVEVRAIRRKP